MNVFIRHTTPALAFACSALLGARAGVRRICLLFWAALWYALGWCVGFVVRVGVLGGVACIQGFADATGWTAALVWLGHGREDT